MFYFSTDYKYFKIFYNIIPLDLRKELALDDDPKSNRKHFTGNVEQNANTKMFFIIEEAKETILNFSQRTVRVL